MESRSVVGTFPATNLSLTVIFPEKALVKGRFAIHIVDEDNAEYTLMLVQLLMTLTILAVFGLVFGAVKYCVRCYLLRLRGPAPECLERCLGLQQIDFDYLSKRRCISREVFSIREVLFEQDRCIVCMEDFVEGEVISSLVCDHVFHICCIKNWVDKKTLKSQLCPVCNQDIRKSSNKKKAETANQLLHRPGPFSTETGDLQPREDRAEAEMVTTNYASEDSVVHLNAS